MQCTEIKLSFSLLQGSNVIWCRVCNQSFPSHQAYTSHPCFHHQQAPTDKPYVCSLCHKGFVTHNGLQGHLKWHKGQYRYSCELCSKGFWSTTGLRAHLSSEHNREDMKFECTVCGRKFTQRSNLNVHIRTKHSGVGGTEGAA